jgi:hypothetical protein
MNTSELYFAMDIETDGQVPGLSSMLQLGICAFDATNPDLGRFRVNISPLPNAYPEWSTMAWWMETPEKQARFAALAIDAVDPELAIRSAVSWIDLVALEHESRKAIAVCSPVGFDFSFFRYYEMLLIGRDHPFGHRALDLRSFSMPLFGQGFMQSSSRDLPSHLLPKTLKHTHDALDDARELAEIGFHLLREAARQRYVIARYEGVCC